MKGASIFLVGLVTSLAVVLPSSGGTPLPQVPESPPEPCYPPSDTRKGNGDVGLGAVIPNPEERKVWKRQAPYYGHPGSYPEPVSVDEPIDAGIEPEDYDSDDLAPHADGSAPARDPPPRASQPGEDPQETDALSELAAPSDDSGAAAGPYGYTENLRAALEDIEDDDYSTDSAPIAVGPGDSLPDEVTAPGTEMSFSSSGQIEQMAGDVEQLDVQDFGEALPEGFAPGCQDRDCDADAILIEIGDPPEGVSSLVDPGALHDHVVPSVRDMWVDAFRRIRG